MTGPMDTLSERMAQLQSEGWTAQLEAVSNGIRCGECGAVTAPEDARVDAMFRFEGSSDPGDESILFGLTPACRHRGTLAAPYGPETPPEVADVVTRLPLDRD